jgi:predicted nucleic acid-binding protein
VTYLLDTNACVALINGTPKEVRRFRRAVVKEATILVSSVVGFNSGTASQRVNVGRPTPSVSTLSSRAR